MTDHAHELDTSVRVAVRELEEMNFTSPEVLLLLGTGAEDITQLIEDPRNISLGELSTAPPAWSDGSLTAGLIDGARVWALTDAPGPDPQPWARAWPIWLSRSAGAGACLLTAAGSALPQGDDLDPQEDFLIASDHIILDGPSTLVSLGTSNLGPLFPDQGRVHDSASRAALIKESGARGIPCCEGVLACVPGPALETPAEREYFSRAGAQASGQNIGPLFHAMAHSGLGGIALIALIGEPEASIEELLESSQRLAPSLAELIQASIPPLAHLSLREREEEL